MNSQSNLLSTGPRRGAAALLSILAAVGVATNLYRGNPFAFSKIESSHPEENRQLSIALANGGCEVSRPNYSSVPILPTWQASYPGSGARMTYMLIKALTGINTAATNSMLLENVDIRDHVVAVKTHFPAIGRFRGYGPLNNDMEHPHAKDLSIYEVLEQGSMSDSRALVILRHPLHAIPSLYNLYYEQLHGLPNHSTRGTNEEWLEWRDSESGVALQIEMFENFVTYWMTKYEDRSDVLFISYENLTNLQTGPGAAVDIAAFLGQQEGVEPIPMESVPCIWDTVVNYKAHKKEDDFDNHGVKNPNSERSGPKVRPYSEAMLRDMNSSLERLLAKFGQDPQVSLILASYVDIVAKTPVEEGLETM